jgi:hypothetical protein
MVLALVICKILLAWVPAEVVHLLRNFVTYSEKRISMERDCCRLIELFAMPTAVALLHCTGIFGCGCPISAKVSLNVIPVGQSWYSTPSSAYTAEKTMNHKAPFNCMGSPFFGIHPKKKCPHALLHAFASERYDTSE